MKLDFLLVRLITSLDDYLYQRVDNRNGDFVLTWSIGFTLQLSNRKAEYYAATNGLRKCLQSFWNEHLCMSN